MAQTFDEFLTVGSAADASPAQMGGLLAGRYTVGDTLGAGGGGTVFAATDGVTGQQVALKRLHGGRAVREDREVRALRMLAVPGVVRLLDSFEAHGARWVVMERVEGTAFPGRDLPADPRLRWQLLAPTVQALLETVQQIHDAGLVHRDLKPSNILVRSDGLPVILDFGLVRGSALGSTITGSGALLGTPTWLAPEQLRGQPVDARADLYAIGTMLFDALAGRPPFPGESWRMRIYEDAPDLGALLPDLPERVARAVQALVARTAERRPASAAEAWAQLAGQSGPTSSLPWLGSRAPITRLVAAARQGQPASVGGPTGSGRTRVLMEAAAVLEAEGRRVLRLVAASRPFGSLEPLDLPTPEGLPAQTFGDHLRAFLDGGGVLVVDDPERLDRWSRRLLADTAGTGAVLSATAKEADVLLASLTQSDLYALFLGPDAILHLREDAAQLLYARTGGHPAQVVAEVRAWQRAGWAKWVDGRLHVGRAALDRLQASPRVTPLPSRIVDLEPSLARVLAWTRLAGPLATAPLLAQAMKMEPWRIALEVDELVMVGALHQAPDGTLAAMARPLRPAPWTHTTRTAAHAALAACLPGPSADRLFHLRAAHLDAVPEAIALAEQWRAAGRPSLAAVALLDVLSSDSVVDAHAFAPALTMAALQSRSPTTLREALHLLDPRRTPTCHALLAAMLAMLDGRSSEVAELLGPSAPEQPSLQVAWWTLRVRAACEDGSASAEKALRAALEGCAPCPEPGVPDFWRGLVAYRQGRFERAAELFRESAETATHAWFRLDALLEASRARLEVGDLTGVEHAAARAATEAAATRQADLEARATVWQRAALARTGVPTPARPELVDAVHALGSPSLEGRLATIEAWLAFRAGDLPVARRLARRAAPSVSRLAGGDGAVYARAMEVAFDDSAEPPADIEALVDAAAHHRLPEMGFDALALLAHAGVLPPRGRTLLRERSLSLSYPHLRRGAFSPAEALAILDDADGQISSGTRGMEPGDVFQP